MNQLALVAQIFCAFYLTGLIWIIQATHYPAFEDIAPEKFAPFHDRHSRALALLAGPVMLLELGSAIVLARGLEPWALGNLGSVLVPFVATFALSVPCHDRLGRGFDPACARRLVRTNWVRTVAWSLRSLGWIAFLSQVPLA